MTTFKEIQGRNIRAVSTDPANPGEGEMWYNKTIGVLKGLPAIEAWAGGGPLITARGWMGSAGDKTAGIVFGGSINPYPTFTGLTEEYNGTGWTSGATAPSPLSGVGTTGVGLQTAALSFGANGGAGYTNNSAHYDGSTWTAGGNMNITGRDRNGAGISTAALGMNAYIPGSQASTNAEEYNGSTWTAITATGSSRYEGMGLGISTSAITCGGRNPPTNNLTASEEWNGSSWTTITNLPQGTHKGQGAGTTTDGCVFGGVGSPFIPAIPYLNNKVDYDGSTWAISPATMTTSRAYFGGDAATSSNIYAAGGSPTPYTANTEEFYKSATVVTGGAWASGGNTNHRTGARLNFGTQNAAMSGGGLYVPVPGYTDETLTEEYDGSAWTAGGNMPAKKGRGAGFGVLTAGVVAGGTLSNTTVDTSFEYNGSAWTSGGSLNVGRRYLSGFGTLTAGAVCGGSPSTPNLATETEEYNGTSWTTSGSLNTARQTFDAAGGVQTSAITFGGEYSGTPRISAAEEYDGATWTSVGSLNTAATRNSGGGTSVPTTLAVGGTTAASPPGTNGVEQYNGTSWVTSGSMATSRSQIGKIQGNSASGLVNNGESSGAYITATEEWTGETTSANVKTFTTS